MRPYSGPRDILLRVLVAGGLIVDAVVHLNYASRYDPVGGTISQGDIFRVESAVALVVSVVLLVAPWRRAAFLAAFVVAAAGFAGVMVYRYVDVGAIGPIPNMYEPVWFFQKTLSAYAEAGAAMIAAVGALLRRV